MDISAWILVCFLSTALLVFIVLASVLTVKLIKLTEIAKKVMIASQGVVEKADDIADNVKNMTSVGGIVKSFFSHYTKGKAK